MKNQPFAFQRPCPRCIRMGEKCEDAPSRRALKSVKRAASSSPASCCGSGPAASVTQASSANSESSSMKLHSSSECDGSENSDSSNASDALTRLDTLEHGEFSLAEVLLALQHAREARFNTGTFLLDATDTQLPQKIMWRMQSVLQASSHMGSAPILAAMRRAGKGRLGASLPLRLLFGVEPNAHANFMRGMITQGSLGMHVAQSLAWDGLHLGVVGMAAAVCAWHDGQATVRAPAGFFVLASPHYCVSTSQERGGLQPSRMRSDLHDILGGSDAPMSLLLERWPHLARVFSAAKPQQLHQARSFLAALEENVQTGSDVAVPVEVTRLHKEYILPLSEAVACNVIVAGRLSGCMYGTDGFANLIGVDAWMSSMPRFVADGQDAGGTPRWMHPRSLLRRCLAFLAARYLGLHSFQYEGQYVRALGLRDSPDSSRPATVLDDMLYSTYYGVETIFEERTPHGQVLACSSYMTDIVFEREPVVIDAQQSLTAELDVIEQLILPNLKQLPLEVQNTCRRTGALPLAAFRDSVLDPELEKVRLRCLLLLVSEEQRAKSSSSTADAAAQEQSSESSGASSESRAISRASQGAVGSSIDQRSSRIAKALLEQNDEASIERVKEDMIISLGGTGIHPAMELHCGGTPTFFALPTAHGRKLIAHISGKALPAGAEASGATQSTSRAHETALSCVPFF